MNKLIYQSQKIQKTLYCQNGVIESVEYRNLLTGNVYSSNSEDVSVKYRRGCGKKAKVVTKADMTLQNADEKGYKLVCKDGSFLLDPGSFRRGARDSAASWRFWRQNRRSPTPQAPGNCPG